MKYSQIMPILTFVVILVMSLVFMPATPAVAQTIMVSPNSGIPGTTVIVSGSGFTSYATQYVHIYFGSSWRGAPFVNAAGTFSLSFVVPSDAAGTVPITVQNSPTYTTSYLALANFTVLSQTDVVLNPISATVGGTVTVTGTGFTVGTNAIITFDTTTVVPIVPITAGGSFIITFTVPESYGGSHTVKVTDASNRFDTASFTTTQSVTVDPNSGAVGSTVTVSGKGFQAASPLTLTYDNAQVATTPASVTTDINGSFSAGFQVPTSSSGTHEVKASDGTYSSSANFTTLATFSLGQTTGHVGDEVTFSGVGFSGTVTIKYDDVEVATAIADVTGAFSATFTAPASEGGEHIITASDNTNKVQATFVMESEAPPAPELQLPEEDSKAEEEAYFDWEDVNDPSGVTYTLQVATDKNFTKDSILLEKAGLSDSEYLLIKREKLESTKKEAPYYWRVKAIDGADNESEWSTPGSFYVMESEAPPVPELQLPAEGIKAEGKTSLDWEDVNDPSGVTYILQLATDEDFTSDSILLEKTGLPNSEYILSEREKLESTKKEAPYYWRVKAIDGAANESDWSTPGSFYVGFSLALPDWAKYAIIGVAVVLSAFIGFLIGRRTAYYSPVK